MTLFSRKSVERIRPLGDRLKRERERLSLTLAAVAAQTGVSEKYLAALENGEYTVIPGEVYRKKFLESYATALSLPVADVYTLYERERKVVVGKDVRKHRVLRQPSVVNLRTFFVRGGIAALVLLLAGYLTVKVLGVLTPPDLVITQPAADARVTDEKLRVEGATAPEATVKLNGQEVFLDADGGFTEDITLTEGLNILSVTAKKDNSKPRTVVRNIVYDPPAPAVTEPRIEQDETGGGTTTN